MESLTELNLCRCSRIKKIPEFSRNMKRVCSLNLSGTAITTLPTSIEHLTESLFLLNLSKTAIRKCPSSIGLLKNLHWLSISGCKGLSSNKLWYELLPFYSMPTSSHPIDLLLSSLSVSPASSLTHLHLNDCNLKAISNDIGSLFSLEWLDLSGNDFVCLLKSIIQLSKLEWMMLKNCTSLRSLPKLPLNIAFVGAEGCISLEMLADPLKPSDSLEPSLYLQNCFQLANNQSCIDWFISGMKKYLKLPHSLPLSFLEKDYNIVIPGSEIPEWFSHQSMENEVKIKQPSHLCKNVGIAICVVARYSTPFPSYSLIANGKRIFIGECTSTVKVSSDHLWLAFRTPQFFDEESNKLLWEGDMNGFSHMRIKIESSNFKVKKWGFHMIYKVKRSRDDYNGSRPNGEGSSNDIPNPKRIKRHIEAHGKSDCEESSEYKDCDEELSDWDESNDSNPDA